MSLKIKFYEDFNLDRTLSCGQCFRWYKIGNIWCSVVSGYKVACWTEDNILNIDSDFDNLNFWINYFGFDIDYSLVLSQIKKIDNIISNAVTENIGIHILRQEPWEVMCSFIISQNNNIKRISKIVSSLCENFGEHKNDIYTFPSAYVISRLSIDDLSVIKAGFRAKYILDVAKKVSSKNVDFSEIQNLSTEKASKILQNINGIGPKVSSCILLFGFHKLDSFPIDTWMKKVVSKFYKDFNQNYFGEYAGIIQQYLFLWSRNHPELFK